MNDSRRRLAVFFVVFSAISFAVAPAAFSQPRAEVLGADVGNCTLRGASIAVSEAANRVYVIRVCNGWLHFDLFDTNLAPIASEMRSVPPDQLYGDPIVDSRGHLFLSRVMTTDGPPERAAGVYHVTPTGENGIGRAFWLDKFVAPALAAFGDGILIASAREHDSGSTIAVWNVAASGDTLWRWQGLARGVDIVGLRMFVENGGRIRVLGTGTPMLRNDSTSFIDVAIAADGSTIHLTRTAFLEKLLRIIRVEPAPDGGIYVLTARSLQLEHFELALLDSGGALRRRTIHRTATSGWISDFRSTASGDLFWFDSWHSDGERIVDCLVRKISADGSERWRLRVDLDSAFQDTIATVSGITAVAIDRHGDPVFGGISRDSYAFTRLDAAGIPVWTAYRPYGVEPGDFQAYVRQIVAGANGTLYAVGLERLPGGSESRTTAMKIVQNVGAGVSRDEESSAASKIFATEPSIAPNPATDAVSLRFTLVRAADVRIELFDLAGEKLATIAKIRGEAGENLHEFSLRSAKIPSGAYLVKISAGEEARIVSIRFMR